MIPGNHTNDELYNSKDLRLHRKYILVVCFILLIMRIGGIELSEVDLIGAKFKLKNLAAIYLGLWIVLFYSLVRYYQYFVHESMGHFSSSYLVIKNRYCTTKIDAIVNKLVHPYQRIQRTPANQAVQPVQYVHLTRKTWLVKQYNSHNFTVTEEHNTNQPRTARMKDISLSFQTHEIKDFWQPTLKTWWYFVIHTPYFFEYIFPFVLTAVTLIICHAGEWDGDLLHVFKGLSTPNVKSQ